MSLVMDRAELIALASPPCHECGRPVQRIEARWTVEDLDGIQTWVPGPHYAVCAEGHRVEVEPL